MESNKANQQGGTEKKEDDSNPFSAAPANNTTGADTSGGWG